VEGVHERELDAGGLDRAALVRAHVRHLDALLAEPVVQLQQRDDLGRELLAECDRVADVVAVPVREGDHVHALGLELRLGTLRVPVEERVDVDPLALWRVEAEAPVTQPRHRHIGHAELLSGRVR
jgi:hypothetical protein